MDAATNTMNMATESQASVRRIPDAPALTGHAEQDGLAAFAFVIREDTTASLSDEAVELALHVAPIALSAPELSQPGLAGINRAIDTLVAARRRRAAAKAAALAALSGGGLDTRSNEGPMAPLAPPPSTQPPSPTKLDALIEAYAARTGMALDEARAFFAAQVTARRQALSAAGDVK